jgi:hypothetical protein
VLESSLEDILRTKRKYHGPGNGGPAGPAYHGNSKGFGMTRKRICQLEVVEKKSIYGMWMDPLLFVKVTLFDPRDIIVLANILDVSMLVLCCRLFVVGLGWVRLLYSRSCASPQEAPLAGIQMQSYESHIPYLLQFTSTFNVSPMGWVHLSQVKVRYTVARSV